MGGQIKVGRGSSSLSTFCWMVQQGEGAVHLSLCGGWAVTRSGEWNESFPKDPVKVHRTVGKVTDWLSVGILYF